MNFAESSNEEDCRNPTSPTAESAFTAEAAAAVGADASITQKAAAAQGAASEGADGESTAEATAAEARDTRITSDTAAAEGAFAERVDDESTSEGTAAGGVNAASTAEGGGAEGASAATPDAAITADGADASITAEATAAEGADASITAEASAAKTSVAAIHPVNPFFLVNLQYGVISLLVLIFCVKMPCSQRECQGIKVGRHEDLVPLVTSSSFQSENSSLLEQDEATQDCQDPQDVQGLPQAQGGAQEGAQSQLQTREPSDGDLRERHGVRHVMWNASVVGLNHWTTSGDHRSCRLPTSALHASRMSIQAIFQMNKTNRKTSDLEECSGGRRRMAC